VAKFASGLTIGLLCALPGAFFGFGYLGNAIWPSYPGPPYMLYLFAQLLVGWVGLGMTLLRAQRPLGFTSGLLAGICAGLICSVLVTGFIITHV